VIVCLLLTYQKRVNIQPSAEQKDVAHPQRWGSTAAQAVAACDRSARTRNGKNDNRAGRNAHMVAGVKWTSVRPLLSGRKGCGRHCQQHSMRTAALNVLAPVPSSP
jgi:hypothetical protein